MEKSFIETQFPVSKISKESYKERKAVQGQTLTSLGKWWGRKPLILVRATILGLLMPASSDTKKDHDIFLKVLGLDEAALLQRQTKTIPLPVLLSYATETERNTYFDNVVNITWKPETAAVKKKWLQQTIFLRMSYDEKLTYCKRPEEMDNIPAESWVEINEHLGTTASSLQELTTQLSQKRYGELVTVGDCFAGGGSIPFEAARIGLNVYASDLNPVAGLLTWSDLNILGASETELDSLNKFQESVYLSVDKEITNWGIEHNEQGDRGNVYLYCNEVSCPSCSWLVPLSPSWVVGQGSKTIARLSPNSANKSFDISIESNVPSTELKRADELGTVKDNGVICPNCKTFSSLSVIRKEKTDTSGVTVTGLRKWSREDFIPRTNDIFQERLYCIRYEKTVKGKTVRYYTAPTSEDLAREAKVIELLSERFADWQARGFIPSSLIESGYNTDQPIRERGWQYWHQLFNPRQLLITSLFVSKVFESDTNTNLARAVLSVHKLADWNSKLCRWGTGQARESAAQTFYNQALNTVYNYPARGLTLLRDFWIFPIKNHNLTNQRIVSVADARRITQNCNFWITDPPYADAVNYHELSEFFLAWDTALLKKAFPEWYTDSHRAEAVKGSGSDFTQAMVDVYKNLSAHMPDNGMQVVMFTHQDPAVWAELTLILWSAGLQVTSAWNIATETESGGLKSGNYVKGTVLMILRKNLTTRSGWLSEIYPEIKSEVKAQIESMRNLDSADDPDFTDNDYLLAAYAASLKVLTGYSTIGDINIQYELTRKRERNVTSPIQDIIESAVRIAFDFLIPKGITKSTWKDFSNEEKFYIKALEFERNGVFTLSSYQELARGLGVSDYTHLLASTKANSARVKTAVEFSNKFLGSTAVGQAFSQSLVRQVLMAIFVAQKEEDANAGKNWLRNELPQYWSSRDRIVEILQMIAVFSSVRDSEHWQVSAQYANYIISMVQNDGI